MSPAGRICLYCSQEIRRDDRAAVCDRCFTAHHEECWERNGRCSTFRCPGNPQTMRGDDVGTALLIAMQRANENPSVCPFCTNRVYPGMLQAHLPKDGNQAAGPGLIFTGRQPNDNRKGITGLLIGKFRMRTWNLTGAFIKARSCGKCKRVFLWGMPLDKSFEEESDPEAKARFCSRCGVALWEGHILIGSRKGGAKFECDFPPDFHKDWIGHNILDRYVLNRWAPPVRKLPAFSCSECRFTEVKGRPIYRF